MNVYQSYPVFENFLFCLRLLENDDTDDLLKVYSDERAVPFFQRIAALQKLGFSETNEKSLGSDGTPYENYFVLTAQ
ncbi:MAG: hypothetical protein HFE47_06825 [Clostridia bacterium]|nr:hypothetical protein [Clostridia bacterium]